MQTLRRFARCLPALALLPALAGCGGGVSIGIGIDGGYDNSLPSVSITASTTIAQSGQSVRLIAAAADESGIDSVVFYQLEGGLPRSLGSVGTPPYEVVVTVPGDGRAVFSVYALAFDRFGNRSQTAPLNIAVIR